ncbi:MAG TPA: hypothetical protein DDY77_05155 [Clostridiales bacterium]|nr:hypothetical protein [Clostridiales bacterium]
MFVTVVGEGESLLFLPGFLCGKEIFEKQITYFSRYYKVIAPSLPGFGGSKTDGEMTIGDYAEKVSSLIEEYSDGKVNIVAHSFGARVVLKMLPDERIGKIVITGGAGLKPKRKLSYYFKILKHKIKRKLGLDVTNDGSADYKLLPDEMKKTFVNVVNEHLDYKLKEIDNNTLLLWGEKDTETPLYMAERFKKGLKSSELVTLKNAGHFVFLDCPSTFNFLVKDFLQNDG